MNRFHTKTRRPTNVRWRGNNRAFIFIDEDKTDDPSTLRDDRTTLLTWPDDVFVDLILSYNREFGNGMRWKSQINVRNLLDNQNLRLIRAVNSGQVTSARRIGEPISVAWTNTFSF